MAFDVRVRIVCQSGTIFASVVTGAAMPLTEEEKQKIREEEEYRQEVRSKHPSKVRPVHPWWAYRVSCCSFTTLAILGLLALLAVAAVSALAR